MLDNSVIGFVLNWKLKIQKAVKNELIFPETPRLKELQSVDTLYKDGNALFRTFSFVEYVVVYMLSCSKYVQVSFVEKSQIISFQNYKYSYLIHTWSDWGTSWESGLCIEDHMKQRKQSL